MKQPKEDVELESKIETPKRKTKTKMGTTKCHADRSAKVGGKRKKLWQDR
jgi:hypothetical protein